MPFGLIPEQRSASSEYPVAMDCQTCDDLIAAYEGAVKLYTEAMQDMAELGDDDFQLALEELERLRVKHREASYALVEHWRQDHKAA